MAGLGAETAVSIHHRIESIWWSDTPPLALKLAEPIYRYFSNRHLTKRAAHVTEPPLPLISIGTITAGGSGKTPFVIWLSRELRTEGFTPVILCRGEGGTAKEPTLVEWDTTAEVVGDEARMLANALNAKVIAAKDRIAGCRMAAELGDIIIFDDGFQYRHLGRSCDIVLVPGEGIGNGHLIPAGPLREPVSSICRADFIVRTGSADRLDQCRPLSNRHEWRWQTAFGELIGMHSESFEKPESVYAVTSIARPKRFLDNLKNCGYRLNGQRLFPDHHRFSSQEIEAMLRYEHVAVTDKDAVKLLPHWPKERVLWVLQYYGEGEPGLLEAIIAKVGKRP